MHKGLGLGLGALLASPLASAEPVPLFPGRLVQAAPCHSKVRAGCWRQAQTLYRFAAEARADLDPLNVDVRLGWNGSELLVRVKGLEATQHIEVVVSKDETDDLGSAQLVKAGTGITQHSLSPAPAAGTTRAVRLTLKDAADGSSRSWAPALDGDLTRPALLWFTAKPRDAAELTIDAADGAWVVSGPNGAQIHIQHRRPALPAGGKGIHPAWSTEVTTGTPFTAPPVSGWFDIRLSADAHGHSAQTAFWRAEPTTHLEQLGIHPAPQELSTIEEDPFILSADATICAMETPTVGEWLAEELTRLTGVAPVLSCEGDPALRIVEAPTDHPEGYRIQARSSGIKIAASSLRGAFYGAMATADLIGFDGEAPAVDVEDWPALETRLFFHEVTPHSGPMTSAEQVSRFISRVVARARYNTLVLELKGGLQSQSHPELSRPDAWTSTELDLVLNTARRFGITVIPTFNTPAHSHWIGRVHPALTEDEATGLLCTRNPETKALIEDMLTELHAAFGEPAFVHIGHDEIGFKTHRKHEAQRCPRCEGTPRWQLLTDDLIWQHSVLAKLNAKPMLWSDMLIQEWHGKHGAMYRAANRIDEDLRPDFHVISWGRVGDTVGTLVPKGYSVIRGNTGYADWKRVGLVDTVDGVKGEALAIFNPIPWSSFEGALGETRLYHHWSNVVLAGATAWAPRIEVTDIDTSLMSLAAHPAYLPGFKAWPADHRAQMFTTRTEPAVAHQLSIPATLTIGNMSTFSSMLFRLEHGESEPYLFKKHVYGLSFVQAVSHGPGLALNKAHNKSPHQRGVSVGEVLITYKDESTASFPLILGLNTNRFDARQRGSMLSEGSGAAGIATQAAASIDPAATERFVYRADWHNPRPEAQLHRIEFKATHPGVTLWVAGVGMALTPPIRIEDDL